MFKPVTFDKYKDQILHIDIIPNLKNYTIEKVQKITGKNPCETSKRFFKLVAK